MNDSEIKKIVKNSFRQILDQRFNLYKNILYKHPLNNILLGFCFEKSASNKEGVYVWVFVQPLYVNADYIVLSFGKRLKGKNGEFWKLKDTLNFEEMISELETSMQNEIDTFLKEVNTPLKFYNYYTEKSVNIRMVQAVVYSAIYSKHKDAESLLKNYITMIKQEDLNYDWIKNLLKEALCLQNIIDSKSSIDDFFDNNINSTKINLGFN
jgi:hypothetical protein